jgi:hypothetical protein
VAVDVEREAGACAQGQPCVLGCLEGVPAYLRLFAKLQENVIVRDLLMSILRSGALNYVRYVRVKGASGDRMIVDERGLITGHVLSPLLYLIESYEMPAFMRDCDVDGVGVDVCGSKLASGHFADDGFRIATTATWMHHLLRRLERYMDDARRKLRREQGDGNHML